MTTQDEEMLKIPVRAIYRCPECLSGVKKMRKFRIIFDCGTTIYTSGQINIKCKERK